MEPECSLPHSQVPFHFPNPEPSLSSHYPTSHFLILSSQLRLGLPSGLFPSAFPTKTLYTPLLSSIRATCSAHFILLYFINGTILSEQYRSFNYSLCSFLHSPATSSLLGSNNLLNTLFSENLSLSSSHNVSDQVSHPYKKMSKIIILYIHTMFEVLCLNIS